MNNENYWLQFMKSGRIEDYLLYSEEYSKKWSGPKPGNEAKNPYAGISDINRNDLKDGAYR